MGLEILTAILLRIQARYETSYARFEIYDDGSWQVTLENEAGERYNVRDGENLSQLPALLSSLK